VILFKAA